MGQEHSSHKDVVPAFLPQVVKWLVKVFISLHSRVFREAFPNYPTEQHPITYHYMTLHHIFTHLLVVSLYFSTLHL